LLTYGVRAIGLRFEAFTVNKINKILPGFKWLKVDKTDVSKTISFLVLRETVVSLRTRTEMVLDTSVLFTFNHLTRLEARENFIKISVCVIRS
jgi:hypothetical protein